jgi:hypothetical protein
MKNLIPKVGLTAVIFKLRAVLGTTEGGAEIILAVYRAPQRPKSRFLKTRFKFAKTISSILHSV